MFNIEECPRPKQEVLSLIRKSTFYRDKEKHINPTLAVKSQGLSVIYFITVMRLEHTPSQGFYNCCYTLRILVPLCRLQTARSLTLNLTG